MGLDPITKFIIKVVVAIYSYNQQRKAQKRAERQARAARSNVLVNKQSNNDPIYPLYGRQRMGGTRVYVEASDGAGAVQTIDAQGKPTNTTHLNLVLAMAEGELETIEQLWFNDTVVWDVAAGGTLDSNGNGGYLLSGFKSGTQYSGAQMKINWYPGSETQTYDTDLNNSVGGAWSTNHRLQGISYLAMVLTANGEKFGGQLPSFTATLKGKKLLNVATLVNGDTIGDMTPANYTSGVDQNPADILYDYLIDRYYGKGLDRDANENWVAGLHIDLASFQQARIDCDNSRSGQGFNLNGFLQTEKQLFDNIGEIMETCNGMVLFVDGKYEFRVKKKNEQLNLPASHVFTKDEIIGDMSLALPTKSAKLNKATGIFNNPVTKYNDDLVIYKNDTFIEEDNGSVLESQEDYTMITDQDLVLDLITQKVDISRDEYQVALKVSHKALLLRSGDIVEIRHPDFGWGTDPGQTQKFWRVAELKLSDDNTVDMTASTYDSSKEL
jgi:hypothetical protein